MMAGLLGLEKEVLVLEINAEYILGCSCGLGVCELLSTCHYTHRDRAPEMKRAYN